MGTTSTPALPDSTSALPEGILVRIFAEFNEMPGLRVTQQQAQRLWGLDAQTCLHALNRMVEIGFLARTSTGEYARLTEGPHTALRMAKAELDTPPHRLAI